MCSLSFFSFEPLNKKYQSNCDLTGHYSTRNYLMEEQWLKLKGLSKQKKERIWKLRSRKWNRREEGDYMWRLLPNYFFFFVIKWLMKLDNDELSWVSCVLPLSKKQKKKKKKPNRWFDFLDCFPILTSPSRKNYLWK